MVDRLRHSVTMLITRTFSSDDAPLTTARLSDTDANVVAALLTGTRFHIKIAEDEPFRHAPEETVAQAC